MSKKSWHMSLDTSGEKIELTTYETADGSTTRIEEGEDYYRSIHDNQGNDRDICVHDHNSDGSEDKTWYNKEGNFIKTEHYDNND